MELYGLRIQVKVLHRVVLFYSISVQTGFWMKEVILA